MEITKKHIIGTLGGFAILAGASYYFYKRSQANLTPLERFIKEFQRKKVVDIIGIQQQFDLVYHLEVGQYLTSTSNQGEEAEGIIQKQRHCGKVIQQGYKCYDCIPDKQFGDDVIDFKEDFSGELFIHTLCEDCFDEQVHKGHRYTQLPFDYLTYCHCGISNMLKESSFCPDHCGYQNLKEEYLLNFSYPIKDKIMIFFNKMIFYLIDGTTEQIQSQKKINLQEIMAKFNILLSIILSQILSLIKENNIYAYCFQEVFQQSFNQPLLLDTVNREKLTFLKTKQIDASKSILDYLFMIFPYYNDSSITKLDDIFKEIGNANHLFYGDISIKFLKYQKIILDVFFKEEQCSDPNILIRISDFYTTCQNGLNNSLTREKIILENQTEALETVILFKELTKKFKFQEYQGAEWFLLLNSNKHIYSLLIFPSLFQKFEKVDEVITVILDQFSYFADFYQLGSGDVANCIEDFVQRNEALFYLLMQQQLLLESIFTFFYKSIKSNNQQIKDRMRKLISQRYQSEIERIFQNQEILQKKRKELSFNLGIKIIYFIVFILFLDNQPLNRQGILNVFKNNFSFKTDQEMEEFISKIIYLLFFYIPQELSPLKDGRSIYVDLINAINTYQLAVWESESSYFWSPQFFNYDLHTFTFQIIYLIGSSKVNLHSLLLNAVQSEEATFTLQGKVNCMINQIMFDQSPYLNIVSDTKELLQEDESITKNIKKAFQSTIIGVISQQEGQSIHLSQLMQQINQFISEEKPINESLEELGQVCKEKNLFKLKKQETDNYHLFNQSRMLQIVETPYTQKMFWNSQYIAKNKKFYLDLFDYQKQLIIKDISNYSLFNQLNLLIKRNQNVYNVIFYTNQIYLLLLAVIDMSKEFPLLFTESQLQETQKIEKEFYDKTFMKELIQKYLEGFALSLQYDQSSRPDIALFLDSYSQIYREKFNESI